MLKIQKYDMCDAITPSDHRPVSAAIDILVGNPSTSREYILSTFNSRSISDGTLPSMHLVKIRIFDLEIKWFDTHLVQENSSLPSWAPFTSSILASSLHNSVSGLEMNMGAQNSSRIRPKTGGAQKCMIYFPLYHEDPLATVRRENLMSQALNVETGPGDGPSSAKNMKYIHSFRIGQSEHEVLEFRSLICLESAR